MSKVLITGATGFVGGFLVEEAVKRNLEVHATVRKSSDLQYIAPFKIEIHHVDINDSVALRTLISTYNFDYIIHNAGITKAKDYETYCHLNVGSVKAFTTAINNLKNSPKFVFISSLAAYGPAELTPDDLVTEDVNPQPVTSYGKSKLKAEIHLAENANFHFNVIRPTAVYGPREKDLYTVFKMINSGLELSIGSKPKKLTFIYVKDLVRGIIDVVLKDTLSGDGFFMSHPTPISNQEFNKIIRNELNKKTLRLNLPISFVTILGSVNEKISSITGSTPALNKEKVNELSALSWECDYKMTQEKIGFLPSTSLRDGIKETAEWYKKNSWL